MFPDIPFLNHFREFLFYITSGISVLYYFREFLFYFFQKFLFISARNSLFISAFISAGRSPLFLPGICEGDSQLSVLKAPITQLASAKQVGQAKAAHLAAYIQQEVVILFFDTDLILLRIGQ